MIGEDDLSPERKSPCLANGSLGGLPLDNGCRDSLRSCVFCALIKSQGHLLFPTECPVWSGAGDIAAVGRSALSMCGDVRCTVHPPQGCDGSSGRCGWPPHHGRGWGSKARPVAHRQDAECPLDTGPVLLPRRHTQKQTAGGFLQLARRALGAQERLTRPAPGIPHFSTHTSSSIGHAFWKERLNRALARRAGAPCLEKVCLRGHPWAGAWQGPSTCACSPLPALLTGAVGAPPESGPTHRASRPGAAEGLPTTCSMDLSSAVFS